jgi:actin-related protein 3
MSTQKPPVVIDNGTGYTKMGYAGNYEPNYIVPTLISVVAEDNKPGAKKDEVKDLDFFIGAEATVKHDNYNVDYPIRHGIIDNWDNMEKYWSRCIYQYLCCDPEEHYTLLTEPPMNTPENREYTAEIMFETFNVPGLYIAVQAVLALCASLLTKGSDAKNSSVTGTVIDSGDGVTHVIPVVEGYVIGSCIKHIPLAGRDVTNFMVQILRDRGEPLDPMQSLEIAKKIKEQYCYVCPDLVKEYNKYDKEPEGRIRQFEGVVEKTKKPFTIDVGYERFLAPEIFFSPEIFSSDWTVPLPATIDACIQGCPIDTRRPLYKYITLSGGTTMFKHFVKRLERDVRRKVKSRYDFTKSKYPDLDIKQIECNVVTHPFQRFAVWFGGSMLASQPEFLSFFHTKAEYAEQGPRLCRSNAVFNQVS